MKSGDYLAGMLDESARAMVDGILDSVRACAAGDLDGMALNQQGALALFGELQRLLNQEERLDKARQVLIEDGYFAADEVGDDLAPRIGEWLMHHRGGSITAGRVEVNVDRLWEDLLPRLESWFGDRFRREVSAAARMYPGPGSAVHM